MADLTNKERITQSNSRLTNISTDLDVLPTIKLDPVAVTPSEETQTISESGSAYSSVQVNPIPQNYEDVTEEVQVQTPMIAEIKTLLRGKVEKEDNLELVAELFGCTKWEYSSFMLDTRTAISSQTFTHSMGVPVKVMVLFADLTANIGQYNIIDVVFVNSFTGTNNSTVVGKYGYFSSASAAYPAATTFARSVVTNDGTTFKIAASTSRYFMNGYEYKYLLLG